MRRRTKLIIGGIAVALALAAIVSSAAARRFEVSEQRFLILFRELTFENNGGGVRAICDVNVEGSFHSRTMSKVSGQLIGYITEASVHRPCRENEVSVLTGTLPWHISYRRFTGALPNITGIEVQLNNGGILATSLGQSCLYEATQPAGIIIIIVIIATERGQPQASSARLDERALIRRREGGILCPAQGNLIGSGTVGTQSAWSLVFVRLVA